MMRVEELRKKVSDADYQVLAAQDKVKNNERKAASVVAIIEDLEGRLVAQRALLRTLNDEETELKQEVIDKETTANNLRAEIPDVEELKQQMNDLTATNQKVRENQRFIAAQALVESEADQIEMLDNEIIVAEGEKQLALGKAEFPVAGLGLSDNGVTFNNLPFAQAGTAEQVRVSVAIGIALNPTLKVLLIRKGNLLDKTSLAAVAAQAEEAGMQVWMEFVSEDGNGMAVMLEDGSLA
jgi:DNA repair ATPase RecN